MLSLSYFYYCSNTILKCCLMSTRVWIDTADETVQIPHRKEVVYICYSNVFKDIMKDSINHAISSITNESFIDIVYSPYIDHYGQYNTVTRKICINSCCNGGDYEHVRTRMFVSLVHELFHYMGHHDEVEVSRLTLLWISNNEYNSCIGEAEACIDRAKLLA